MTAAYPPSGAADVEAGDAALVVGGDRDTLEDVVDLLVYLAVAMTVSAGSTTSSGFGGWIEAERRRLIAGRSARSQRTTGSA